MPDSEPPEAGDPSDAGRRTFLTNVSKAAMAGGLVASYGTLAAFAGRYLYPARPPRRDWLFVATTATLKPGTSLAYRAPSGAGIAVARRGTGEAASDFVALSSTCPHLGCQVRWEQPQGRFFCPCHNGAFDASGVAIAGPPAEARQDLPRYPLKVDGGLLYIEVPVESV